MTRTQVLQSIVRKAAKESYMNIKSNSPELVLALYAVSNLEEKIRPFKWIGIGRHARAWDQRAATARLLKQANINFEIGNDAPRGGKSGEYIIVKLEQ
jgi:hypothetical protein